MAGLQTLFTVVAIWEDIKYILHNITHLFPKGYAEAQLGHPLFAKYVPSHDVISGEPIAISGTNSRFRANTEQKKPKYHFTRHGNRTQDLRELLYRACNTTTPPRHSKIYSTTSIICGINLF
ncbi:hypothetical protein O3G_MSEX000242 [Manduca sexta]|nr:hypothetical protein O3G_MSEX000242 [Manduca sexta]